MENFEKKFNALKEIKLTRPEYQEGWSKILDFMELKPETQVVRSTKVFRHQEVWRSRSHHIINLIYKKRFMQILATIAIMAMLGGGTSFAAGDALPGSFLYPVKINLNENVRGALALGAKADAKWELEKIDRRLSEAEELIAENGYDAELAAMIEERLEAHVEALASNSEEAADDSFNAILRSDLEARLAAHIEALEELQGKVNDSAREKILELLVRLRARAVANSEARVNAENRFINSSVNAEAGASFAGQLQAAQSAVSRAESKALELEADTEAYARAQVLIEAAQQNIIDAQAEFEADNQVSAFELLFEARRNANRVESLVRVKVNLGQGLNLKLDAAYEEKDGDDSDTDSDDGEQSEDEDVEDDDADEADDSDQEDEDESDNDAESKVDVDINADINGKADLNL